MGQEYKQNFRVVGFISLPSEDIPKTKSSKLECRDLDNVEYIRCKICDASVLLAFYCPNCGTMHTEVIEDYINGQNINKNR